MSLSQLLTHNGSQALYAPYTVTGGGGGGGGAVSTISQFFTSSISGIAGNFINVTDRLDAQQINVAGELNMLNDSLNFSGGVAGGNIIQFGLSQGEITGLSTVNGVAYPPPTSPPASSTSYQLSVPTGPGATIVLTGGTTGGASDCTAPWTGVVNDYYRVCITFTVSTTSGSPAADAFLFFQLFNNTIQQVHVPYASIAQSIPQQISITARAATTTPTLQVGLNDSAGAVVTFNITNTAGAPSIVMEQLGAPLPSP